MKKLILSAISILLAGVLCSCGTDAQVEHIKRVTRGLFQEKEYDRIPDKWENEWVSDHEAASEVIEALLSSADAGDREAFAENFTKELQQSDDFSERLDEFFIAYPTGFSECELDGGLVSSEASYHYGDTYSTGSTYYECWLDGEWYFISLGFCHQNTYDADKLGVTRFTVMNLEARAVYIDISNREYDSFEDEYLQCEITSSDEVDARLIAGNPFLWTPTDNPKLTAEEMHDLFAGYRDLGAKEIMDTIGKANAAIKYSNCTGYDYYYELAPENGEPRYAYISTSSPYGRIIDAYACSSEEILFDEVIREHKKP